MDSFHIEQGEREVFEDVLLRLFAPSVGHSGERFEGFGIAGEVGSVDYEVDKLLGQRRVHLHDSRKAKLGRR